MPSRVRMGRLCATAAAGVVAVVILGAECAIYAALTGEPLSLLTAVDGLTRAVCGLLRVCSA
ncbi:hypothetical protein [Hydrogenophaga laconesensis]|uniref:Uncharacterized protein n=1 Tax=Hydrogenophaga laconesensis TaxID=1805971 RepID=A0ABU1V863_9BURK|nr:hypothetical protein [Hydrogenophaga laconesensis]MDR7093602.1 hypothetical protein [Hydrogenophaga laconesensis]